MDLSKLHAQLPHTLQGTDFPTLGTRYQGKVRDVYAKGDRLVLVATDRLSAFDRILTTLPFKGEILNRLANFWFEKTKDVVPNHVLEVPDPSVTVARACEPIRVEMVVRGYLTGSLWRDYQKGQHGVYGVPIPDGMKKDQAFPSPILTPATKAEVGEHDEPISAEGLVARGLTSRRDWERMSEAALALFQAGQAWAKSRGLLLVDTKYEFGKVGDTLYVIDEIHTPDSSRYWVAGEYAGRFGQGSDQRMLDKENLRQWLIKERGFMGEGESPTIPDDVRVDLASKYVAAYETITGAPLALEVGPVASRIERNLKAAGLL
ncbi:MAG: phosphoribosylaminoimidazolesuccinocarboxamide synthase [Myxococcaceae bacterium]|nr:phosphoribosylaminoimidazolesuccinocarboxamide synthase [Myxococcaceae bacterium]